MNGSATRPSLRQGIVVVPRLQQHRWGTVLFMLASHGLAVLALLPRFWSGQAVAALLLLYWLTACVGVTLGYHRLLAHRAFAVPAWLEAVITTCGTLSCQQAKPCLSPCTQWQAPTQGRAAPGGDAPLPARDHQAWLQHVL